MSATSGVFVRIFGWKNGYGLVQDSAVLGRFLEAFRLPGGSGSGRIHVEHCDPLVWMPPRDVTGAVAHIHIYMEQPCRLAIPWATYNVMVVNPEWFYTGAWDWCAQEGGMDLFVFKDPAAAAAFGGIYHSARKVVIPWTSPPMDGMVAVAPWAERERRFLYLIGGSVNKAAAAREIVAAWQADWPPLEIWCSEKIAEVLRPLVPRGCASLVEFQTTYRSVAEREARQKACAWHVVASAAEGFGYTMAEAASCGAPVLWTDLPVYRWLWGSALNSVGRISVVPGKDASALDNGWTIECPGAIRSAVESLLTLRPADVRRLQEGLQGRRSWALREFRAGWERVLRQAARSAHGTGVPAGPLRQRAGEELPMVGVVTVTRNRRAWWPNMVENIQRQRWPVSRLVWIVVDDSDAGQRLETEVAVLQEKVPTLSVVYRAVTAEEKAAGLSLGAKRNLGVMAARAAGATYALMMDDDDHYPETSVPERMRWLLRAPGVDAVFCATIPMYDVTRYISAMNVPPLKLGLAERVSEATVGFRIPSPLVMTDEDGEDIIDDEVRVFADTSMAEGAGLFSDALGWKTSAVREIPPMGIIVSFIHAANTSSRRVPEEQEPNGCHYGFSDDYFRYIHTIGST